MKSRSQKTEQYKLWFYDLEGTAALLNEKSENGWHLAEVDVDSGKFTYKKGESKNYFYVIEVNGSSYDFSIYSGAFEKVCEDSGLAFYRIEEEAKEALVTEKQKFKENETQAEEDYLNEKAKEGLVLLRCSRPEYTFVMCESSDIKYKIDYCEETENPEEYINKFSQAGFEYVCGYNGYHYFCTENARGSDESVFDSENINQKISENKSKEFESILWVAVIGGLLSLIKFIFNFKEYLSAVSQELLQKYSRSIVMDLAALLVSVVAFCWVLIIRKRKNK
ncbi:MAG: DUF2812 domain-containing protein [Clostridiales bacterium]|nr:DUF2812 domain-containing protein [Clostridiales bacterium]